MGARVTSVRDREVLEALGIRCTCSLAPNVSRGAQVVWELSGRRGGRGCGSGVFPGVDA